MVQILSIDRSNRAGDKDWLLVSKELIINAYTEEPQVVMTTSSESIFTKDDFEVALKKVSRKISK